MKVKLTYPVYLLSSTEIEMTQEQFEEIENMNMDDKAAFIYNTLGEIPHNIDYDSTSWKFILHGLDIGDASIKIV